MSDLLLVILPSDFPANPPTLSPLYVVAVGIPEAIVIAVAVTVPACVLQSIISEFEPPVYPTNPPTIELPDIVPFSIYAPSILLLLYPTNPPTY